SSDVVFYEAILSVDLADLDKKNYYERKCESDITVFKSVGTALSDLITAHYIYKSLKNE
ncbi:ornithine cyclodeaminase, partial [Pseudoalteromonas sp. S1649]